MFVIPLSLLFSLCLSTANGIVSHRNLHHLARDLDEFAIGRKGRPHRPLPLLMEPPHQEIPQEKQAVDPQELQEKRNDPLQNKPNENAVQEKDDDDKALKNIVEKDDNDKALKNGDDKEKVPAEKEFDANEDDEPQKKMRDDLKDPGLPPDREGLSRLQIIVAILVVAVGIGIFATRKLWAGRTASQKMLEIAASEKPLLEDL
jgi:hypothetical protein